MENKIENSLKPEQEKILMEIYKWQDGAEFKEDEIQRLREMFVEPRDFYILRKALGIFTAEERGLLFPHKAVNMSKEDYQVYQIADEQIRASLANLYMVLKKEKQEEKRKELKKENEEERNEKERVEELKEEDKIRKRIVGENI